MPAVTPSTAELEDALAVDRDGVTRVPVLVKGRLALAPRVDAERLRAISGGDEGPAERFTVDGAHVIRRPVRDPATLAPTDASQFLLLPRVEPGALVERDVGALARELYRLPLAEIADYVAALGAALRELEPLTERVAAYTKATTAAPHAGVDLGIGMLHRLLDPAALIEAVDRELGSDGVPGRRYLDGWVEVGGQDQPGATARLARRILPATAAAVPCAPRRMRAMPTRQLHITAGNALAVPLVSALRAFATKSAAVVKSPAEATAAAAALAMAMHRVDPEHPLTRHTSLVYWPGGDRAIEDPLLRAGAFDRIVVWGSQETMASLHGRVEQAKTVFLGPRVGVSLIGRGALEDGLEATARRAVADSMAGDQRACMASLVHYVEGSASEVQDYCRAAQAALRAWDAALPHAIARADLGRLRWLRRGPMLSGEWFENGHGSHVSSAVVYLKAPFDLATHPMSRLVVVRRVDDLAQALDYVHAGISTVGVAPERRRAELRDELAARGVSNVLPLGDCERAYPGMPQDGMRLLSELVNWVTA